MSELHAAEQVPAPGSPGSREPDLVLRFVTSERALHWALAIPFVALYATAVAMILAWGEAPPRDVRTFFSWAHRLLGVCLVVLPPVVLTRGFREWRVHWDNVREGWRWDRNDVRWLLLMPLAAVDKRITLPDQGKFNAAEKLNFMMVSASYPLYIVTGILLWLPGMSFVPWVLHFAVAVLGAALIAGHIFMATVNPTTRVGLSGMVTGFVDREWARHHYRRWFDQRHPAAPATDVLPMLHQQLARPALVRCASCSATHAFRSWSDVTRRAFQVEPLFCPACAKALLPVHPGDTSGQAEAILRHAEAHPDEPYTPAAAPPAVPRQPAFEAA